MPYIRRLPSGKWQATVRHPSGRKVTKTDTLKRVVQTWAEEVERSYRLGHAPAARTRRLTVAEWHQQWTASRMVEPSTARKDDSRWRNHLQPHWGTWPLDAVTRLDVQTWVKHLTQTGLGASGVRGAYQLLTQLLAAAVDHNLLTTSPCRKVTLPRAAKPEPRWLTRHEYDLLQLALEQRTLVLAGGQVTVPDPHRGVYRALVGLGCYAGLRPGELAGLDVAHVDLDRRLVYVRQVVTPVPNGAGGYSPALRPYGKSDRATRSVPFPDDVADLLWPLVADRTDGPLFTSPRGGRIHMTGNFPYSVWRPALQAAGIEKVRPYVMRHTAASWLVQAGVPDRQIMAILGHADTHLIDVYAHLAPDAHDVVRSAWRTGGAHPALDGGGIERMGRSQGSRSAPTP